MQTGGGAVWRTFKFFEHDALKCPAMEQLGITAAACGRNRLYLGDSSGMVRVFERSGMALLDEFQAFTGPVAHIKALRGARNVLVVIGDDYEPGQQEQSHQDTAIIRWWDMDREGGAMRELRLFGPRRPPPEARVPVRVNYSAAVELKLQGQRSAQEPGAAGTPQPQDAGLLSSAQLTTCVSCFDVSDDLQQLALGLSNNTILFARGDLDRSPKVRVLTPKYSTERLTFVGLPKLPSPEGSQSFAALLYAVFEDVTTVFPLPQRFADPVEERAFEYKVGAGPECAAINDDGELYVAPHGKAEVAIFGGREFVEERQRSGWADPPSVRALAPAVEGRKLRLCFHKEYFVLLTKPDGPVGGDAARAPGKASSGEKFSLGIYDREARIRAVTQSQGAQVNAAWVLPDVSDVLVISQEPRTDRPSLRLSKYLEVDTQAKIDLLFRKDMSEEAKRIGRRLISGGKTADEEAQGYAIQRKFGDHLYDKGLFDEATQQYIEALKGTEPSYVIRKFLGEQRIGNLAKYLEALHEQRHQVGSGGGDKAVSKGAVANKNHTTLLLNCYAKLKQRDSLMAFIRRTDITLDAETAIRVCRQAGYYDAATELAKTHNLPREYVRILVDNLGRHTDALRFTATLPLGLAASVLQEHGKVFLRHAPREATDILTLLCTRWPVTGTSTGSGGGSGSEQWRQNSGMGDQTFAPARPLIPAFVDTPCALLFFLRAVVKETYTRSPHDTPLIQGMSESIETEGTREVLSTLLELCLADDLPARVQHGVIASAADPGAQAHVDPAGALPERPETSVAPAPHKGERMQWAMDLLERYRGQYDPYHALTLAQRAEWEVGVLFLLRGLGLHSEVFAHHAKRFETAPTREERDRAKLALFSACEECEALGRGGSAAKDMWVSLLSILVRSTDDVAEDVTRLLSRVERESLLPPVAVVEILGASPNLPLRAVREYILSALARDQEAVDRCRKDAAQFSQETIKARDELTTLQCKAHVFQAPLCHQCDQQLDLPAVHLLCGHSFHQRCLTDQRQCNQCAPNHQRAEARAREYKQLASDHDAFFSRLREQDTADGDGFAVIAEYFGRGIFDAAQPAAVAEDDRALLGGDDQDLETW